MAILKIHRFGKDLQSTPAARVNFNAVERKLPKIIEDMTQTCLSLDGVGLAAPQVGLDMALAIVLINIGDDDNPKYQRYVLINPEVTSPKDTQVGQEGCLSLPGIWADVERAKEIKVKALNERGLPVEIKAKDRLAVIMQHEIDHLNGKVFIDHLPAQQRAQLAAQLKNPSKK